MRGGGHGSEKQQAVVAGRVPAAGDGINEFLNFAAGKVFALVPPCRPASVPLRRSPCLSHFVEGCALSKARKPAPSGAGP